MLSYDKKKLLVACFAYSMNGCPPVCRWDLTGFCGDGSVLLPTSVVYGDERPSVSSNVEPTLLRLHNILLLFLFGRDCPPWQVSHKSHLTSLELHDELVFGCMN